MFENYAASKANKVAKRTGTLDQQAILEALPAFFEHVLITLGRQVEYLVEGSIGNGNVARVPWVAIFRREITVSAQRGFYIVLLFAEDMSCCYLSLNQGFTEYSQQFSDKTAHQKIGWVSAQAGKHLLQEEETIHGRIDLRATGALGKGYEAAAIKSYVYFPDRLPDPEVVRRQFQKLLSDYDVLYRSFGPSLSSLATQSEGQFQEAVIEKAAKPRTMEFVEPPGGLHKPPKRSVASTEKYVRNPEVAAAALMRANFRCEVNAAHITFLTRKQPYVEAHHLIPFSRQDDYEYSLDVVANLVALCPTCHRQLHYGRARDKRPVLMALLQRRHARLLEKQILIEAETLLDYYKAPLLEDDD
ncbi:MrcB family domain-containing protein [Bordetella pseudohinzii]|uniref:MrcB family domain-containing protein n=1 Tax=Bordetella pseudohinzii TaxID=1331258 RepID=UPI0013F4CA5D|nr:DUF3578 domain-containing protein [Bordetella pseudohinzii]